MGKDKLAQTEMVPFLVNTGLRLPASSVSMTRGGAINKAGECRMVGVLPVGGLGGVAPADLGGGAGHASKFNAQNRAVRFKELVRVEPVGGQGPQVSLVATKPHWTVR
jgi:hypothetical protein